MATVLVVDDEPDIRFLYELWLRRRGFDVRVAVDGEEALNIASEESVDVVLLDVMMPKMDGIEVCRRLRAGNRKTLPIIMLSALARPSDIEAGKAAGADAYLTKPENPDEIVGLIGELLAS